VQEEDFRGRLWLPHQPWGSVARLDPQQLWAEEGGPGGWHSVQARKGAGLRRHQGWASKPRPASVSFVLQCVVQAGQYHHGSRRIFLPSSSFPLHFTDSSAPSSEAITNQREMRFQHPICSLRVRAGSSPGLKLNSHTPCSKHQLTCSYSHHGIFHIHFELYFRKLVPTPYLQISSQSGRDHLHAQGWLLGSTQLCTCRSGAASKPGTRRRESWTSTPASAPSVSPCQVPGTFIQRCSRMSMGANSMATSWDRPPTAGQAEREGSLLSAALWVWHWCSRRVPPAPALRIRKIVSGKPKVSLQIWSPAEFI